MPDNRPAWPGGGTCAVTLTFDNFGEALDLFGGIGSWRNLAVFDFTNDVVLVTGAASGIGFEIARTFAASGARVALGDFRLEALTAAVSRMPQPERHYAETVDVRDARSVAELVDRAEEAVVMFTKVLAMELAAHAINVNTIAPGLVTVESSMSPISPEYAAAMTRMIPWGRPGKPSDIANAALFLASPYAEFITGEVLAVDGGSSTGRPNLPLSSPQ